MLPAVHPLRSGAGGAGGVLSGSAGVRARVWALGVGERSLLDPAAWRRFARGQVRVMGVGCALSLLTAAAGLRLTRRATR